MNKNRNASAGKKIPFPNFLGTEFLISVSRLFVQWAGLAEAGAEAQQRFSRAVIGDFLEKGSATLLDAVDKARVPELMALSGRQMFFEEREKKLKELVPDYDLKMKALLNFFKKRIERGYYDISKE
jgi:hypothetical protein